MARICELTGTRPIKGSHIWRSGKAKKKGGIGTHITAITKRRFFPNLQRVKALIDGEVRYIRVTAKALKKGLVVKAPKRSVFTNHTNNRQDRVPPHIALGYSVSISTSP